VRARFETGSSLSAALLAFERLWHEPALLDRMGQSQCGGLKAKERAARVAIERVREYASDYLRALAAWMRGGGPLPTAERFFGPLNDTTAAIRSDIAAAISGIDADLRQLQSLSTRSFALEQVGGTLESIAGHFADRVSRLEDDGTAPALLISHPRQTT